MQILWWSHRQNTYHRILHPIQSVLDLVWLQTNSCFLFSSWLMNHFSLLSFVILAVFSSNFSVTYFLILFLYYSVVSLWLEKIQYYVWLWIGWYMFVILIIMSINTFSLFSSLWLKFTPMFGFHNEAFWWNSKKCNYKYETKAKEQQFDHNSDDWCVVCLCTTYVIIIMK